MTFCESVSEACLGPVSKKIPKLVTEIVWFHHSESITERIKDHHVEPGFRHCLVCRRRFRCK